MCIRTARRYIIENNNIQWHAYTLVKDFTYYLCKGKILTIF